MSFEINDRVRVIGGSEEGTIAQIGHDFAIVKFDDGPKVIHLTVLSKVLDSPTLACGKPVSELRKGDILAVGSPNGSQSTFSIKDTDGSILVIIDTRTADRLSIDKLYFVGSPQLRVGDKVEARSRVGQEWRKGTISVVDPCTVMPYNVLFDNTSDGVWIHSHNVRAISTSFEVGDIIRYKDRLGTVDEVVDHSKSPRYNIVVEDKTYAPDHYQVSAQELTFVGKPTLEIGTAVIVASGSSHGEVSRIAEKVEGDSSCYTLEDGCDYYAHEIKAAEGIDFLPGDCVLYEDRLATIESVKHVDSKTTVCLSVCEFFSRRYVSDHIPVEKLEFIGRRDLSLGDEVHVIFGNHAGMKGEIVDIDGDGTPYYVKSVTKDRSSTYEYVSTHEVVKDEPRDFKVDDRVFVSDGQQSLIGVCRITSVLGSTCIVTKCNAPSMTKQVAKDKIVVLPAKAETEEEKPKEQQEDKPEYLDSVGAKIVVGALVVKDANPEYGIGKVIVLDTTSFGALKVGVSFANAVGHNLGGRISEDNGEWTDPTNLTVYADSEEAFPILLDKCETQIKYNSKLNFDHEGLSGTGFLRCVNQSTLGILIIESDDESCGHRLNSTNAKVFGTPLPMDCSVKGWNVPCHDIRVIEKKEKSYQDVNGSDISVGNLVIHREYEDYGIGIVAKLCETAVSVIFTNPTRGRTADLSEKTMIGIKSDDLRIIAESESEFPGITLADGETLKWNSFVEFDYQGRKGLGIVRVIRNPDSSPRLGLYVLDSVAQAHCGGSCHYLAGNLARRLFGKPLEAPKGWWIPTDQGVLAKEQHGELESKQEADTETKDETECEPEAIVRDKFGVTIKEGSLVVYPARSHFGIGKVTDIEEFSSGSFEVTMNFAYGTTNYGCVNHELVVVAESEEKFPDVDIKGKKLRWDSKIRFTFEGNTFHGLVYRIDTSDDTLGLRVIDGPIEDDGHELDNVDCFGIALETMDGLWIDFETCVILGDEREIVEVDTCTDFTGTDEEEAKILLSQAAFLGLVLLSDYQSCGCIGDKELSQSVKKHADELAKGVLGEFPADKLYPLFAVAENADVDIEEWISENR